MIYMFQCPSVCIFQLEIHCLDSKVVDSVGIQAQSESGSKNHPPTLNPIAQ